jgi:lysophospholipase L1-like esterase
MLLKESDPTLDSHPAFTGQYKSLLKYFAVRLCVAVTLGVLLLAAVEFYSYSRYLPDARDTLEPAIKLELTQGSSASEREYWKEFVQSNKVIYHPYVLWRRAPYHGELVSINEDGVRRTLHTQCDDKTFTIWMFGDSVMWGFGAPDEETIPSLIAANYEKAGRRVCIVNYGEKGWSSTQEVIGLIEQLKHASRKPDIVLFYDGESDLFSLYQNGRADVHTNYETFKKFLDNWSAGRKAGFSYFNQTNTYRLLDRIAAKIASHRNKDETPAAGPDLEALSGAVVHNYLQNMDIVELLAKQYAFRPIFMWYPDMIVGHKELTTYEQEVLRMSENDEFPGLGLIYQAAYKEARQLNRPDFLYLGDLLDDQKDWLYIGVSHLRPEGNRIVANRLFDILEHLESSQGSGFRSSFERGN